MEGDGDLEGCLGTANARYVIQVSVRQQDVLDRQAVLPACFEETVHFVSWIDEHGLPGVGTGHDEPVLLERGNRSDLEYHA
jgi:hypothetical protein